MVFRPLPFMTVAAVLSLALLISLGNWQVQRLAWKEDLIAMVQARIADDPLELFGALAAAPLAEIDYVPVRVSGEFDHSREVHLFARDENGRAGVNIYAPLITEDGRAVIINRGFVPQHLKQVETRPLSQTDGLVDVVGLVRLPAERGRFDPANDLDANLWFVRDLNQMAEYMGLDIVAPVFVEAGPSSDATPWPQGGQTRVEFQNRHLGYALTWYGLAMTLIAVYIAVHVAQGRLGFRKDRA